MVKTNGAFKLSKESKRALAITKDPQQRGAWRKSFEQTARWRDE